MKTALITGITGQDGSYLAELLWKRDIRSWNKAKELSINRDRIDHLFFDKALPTAFIFITETLQMHPISSR